MDHQPHILLVTFPGQGHINPSLQFAKSLLRIGARVTFATSISAHRLMAKNPSSAPAGLSFATYSDGYDDGFPADGDVNLYMAEIRRTGSKTLTDLIESKRKEGCNFTCLVYTVLIPWVAEVARALHMPSTLLWNQPASVFLIYYYYFNGYRDVIVENMSNPSWVIELPGLPLLAGRDMPSFLHPSSAYTFALPALQEQLEILKEEPGRKILVNTFDALEAKALRAVKNDYNLIGVGPLIPSAILDGKDQSDTSFGGDLFQAGSNDNNYIAWLNSKNEASVIYISFGSISVFSKRQTEEIARCLLEIGRPFLWVTRGKEKLWEDDKENFSYMKKLLEHQQGKIVSWCSQVEVLSHASVGCFVTHCGWNSSLESLVSGVPVVAVPQWSDQWTNAKLIQDVWKTGMRVEVNKEGIVECEELKRCLELVVEQERGVEIKRNAKKWKDLAREARHEKILRDFVNDVGSY